MWIVRLCFVLALSGCVSGLAQRQAFLRQFIGRSEHDVVQVLGVPNRTYSANGTRYIAYEEREIEILPSPFLGTWWRHGWYGGGFPPEVINRVCDTTFAIGGNVVESYTLRGNACG